LPQLLVCNPINGSYFCEMLHHPFDLSRPCYLLNFSPLLKISPLFPSKKSFTLVLIICQSYWEVSLSRLFVSCRLCFATLNCEGGTTFLASLLWLLIQCRAIGG
jgi:hypothetical protein